MDRIVGRDNDVAPKPIRFPTIGQQVRTVRLRVWARIARYSVTRRICTAQVRILYFLTGWVRCANMVVFGLDGRYGENALLK